MKKGCPQSLGIRESKPEYGKNNPLKAKQRNSVNLNK
jgi:hypothetical protein